MNYLWKKIEEKSWKTGTKRNVYLTETTLIAAVIGWLIWLVAGRLVLPAMDWMICFIFYPGFIGFVAGVIKIYHIENADKKKFAEIYKQ